MFSIDYKNIERLNSKPFFKPSICFAKIGEACKLNRKKVIKSNFYFIDNNMSSLIPFDNIEFYYFYYFLCKLNFNSFIKTSNLPSIDIDMLKNHKIFYPDIKEQIKISKFFSLLDKHIELWERKLQLYLLKKKYYLNKLYIDNDLFPHLRFKEFNNDKSKYKCDNLFNLCSFVKSGGTPASTNKDYYSGNIPFCSISDFDKNYLKCTKKYISDQAILDSSSFIFPKNNILLSIYASIGEVAINLIDVALPQSILGLIVSKIDLYYLFHLLQTNKMKRFFVNYSEQGTQPNLSKKTLKFLKIWFVDNKDEQTNISKLLFRFSKQINHFESIINFLKSRRNYYLNKLFI